MLKARSLRAIVLYSLVVLSAPAVGQAFEKKNFHHNECWLKWT